MWGITRLVEGMLAGDTTALYVLIFTVVVAISIVVSTDLIQRRRKLQRNLQRERQFIAVCRTAGICRPGSPCPGRYRTLHGGLGLPPLDLAVQPDHSIPVQNIARREPSEAILDPSTT